MNWEAIGAIAGLIGVGLVIVSLLYVGIQVRQSNKTSRAATELETAQMYTEFLARTAHSQDMADIWDTGHANPDHLTATQKRRFIWIISEYFSIAELFYQQRDLNYLSQESRAAQEATVAGMRQNPIFGQLVDHWSYPAYAVIQSND
jgi:hypothetical protein